MINPDSTAGYHPGFHCRQCSAGPGQAGDLPGRGPAGDILERRCHRRLPWTLSGRRYPRAQLPAWSRDRSCRCSPWIPLPAITPDSTAGYHPGFRCRRSSWTSAPMIALDVGADDRPGRGPAGDILERRCHRRLPWTLSGRRYPRAQLQAWSRDRSCRCSPWIFPHVSVISILDFCWSQTP